jgi:tRNA dimethylallyltransferase
VSEPLQKLIAVVGPTAAGKTDLAIQLAKEFNGEIISADSRQIYTKLEIGTAKPAGTWRMVERKKRYIVDGVPHYAMDFIDPGKPFTVAEFQALAFECIKDITMRGKLPFLVGGTGLYVWSVVDNLKIPERPPMKKLRESFEKKTLEELVALLDTVDPAAFKIVDKKNKRRVIRALEVAISTGESFVQQRTKEEPIVDALQIGVTWPLTELYQRIEQRADAQWKNGLVQEVQRLLRQKYSFDLQSLSSIGYRQVAHYLQGELSEKEALAHFKRDTRRYAKRQITWFKRDKRIHWIDATEYELAKEDVKKFLNEKTAQ